MTLYDWRGSEYEPTFPAFTEFRDLGGGYRMVGSTILDEETFQAEGWHEFRGELHPTVQGIARHSKVRERRKSDRKSAWQQRQDADSENTDYINGLLDEAGK